MDSDKIPPDVGKQTTSGGIAMKKRNYTHIQVLPPEIKAMLAEGKTQREVLEARILPRPKGRSRKGTAPTDIVAGQAYEMQRLRMENQLLRDFLHFTGRK